ncbi:leucine-rich repeat domain-containing protein [Pseudomonas sp. SWRI102]|uniref:Leucine-rich repeat domain-containing protein n=1 Tax=Pseudomonas marvdashtae TaxID=2745500 RepID=A0A923FMV4_9PSED|nr:leucine-rich repeat domain-containing protein [Pseudomonas marvdashtae]MBV4551945.1 leucine-rich repeat domain-containing protein [Pseudomonas marvdashtae]
MSTLKTHVELIQARLPGWLTQATRASQERLKALAQQLQRDSDALNALVKDWPDPYDYTLDQLQAQPEMQAWGPVIGASAKDAVRRARVKRGPYVIDPSLTVVEAAMGNFPPADAVVNSDFDRKGQLYVRRKPDEHYRWGQRSDTVGMPLSPAQFAQVCRRVDVGGTYRKLLESKLPRIAGQDAAAPTAYKAYARSQLAYDAYEAKLDGRLDKTGERLLASAGVQLENEPTVPLACEFKTLELLSVPLFGVRVYWGVKGDAKGVRPVVLHMPNDVVAPIMQFSSLQAMSAELTERVRKRSYRTSLMNYFPLRLQAELGMALHDQVEWEIKDNLNLFQEINARISHWREGERGEDDGRIRVPAPRVAWGLGYIREEHWSNRYHEWRGHTFANASALMVSTTDKDWQALMDRLEYWERIAEQTLMLAASFVPFCAPIGMAAAAVGGVRLVYEIFEGIQAFNEGHAQEGIDHIFNVLFGIAQGAYLGFTGAAIEPMPVKDGTLRLWNGDVTPFQTRRLPGMEAEQDAWGVWRTPSEAWVRIDDHYFEVQGQGSSVELRLPAGHRGVTPPLEWSRTRGWRWAHQNPLHRNNLQLVHNFAETPAELDDNTLLAVQRQVGISEAHLRYLQVEGRPMPAVLADALVETRNWSWVHRTIQRLKQNQAPGEVHFRGVQMLAELPGWPRDVALRYHDGAQYYPMGNPASTRVLSLSKWDLENDAWAARILDRLRMNEQTALLGQNSFGLSPLERNRLLAGRWARQLENNTQRIISDMASRPELDPLAAPLARDFPGLPASMANELAGHAAGRDRARLLEGRVSEGLGNQCAEALRELRLSRALRNLERGESSVDRDRLIMGLVGRAPQLRGRVRLRLFAREAPRPIEVGEAGPWKIIRQENEQYRAFDEEGNELADAPGLEDALLRAMPDDARRALGLNIWEGATFRTRLLAQALEDRQGLRPLLMMKPHGQGGAGLQWINERWGYPASGRGQLPLHVWNRGLAARLEQLYPSYAGEDLEILQESLTQEATRHNINLGNFVAQLENDWATLNNELDQWEAHPGLHHPAEGNVNVEVRRSQRRAVAAQIRSAWQRVPDPSNEGSDMVLRLDGSNIGRLPPISVRFEHIEELILMDLGLSEDPSAFLRLFPNIDTLYLQGNQLSAIPLATGELRQLTDLSLSINPLNMTADVFAPLLGPDLAPHLEILSLSHVSSGTGAAASSAVVSAIGRLAELPSLRELEWTDNLHFTEQQLQAITELPQLTALDLSRCGLRLDEQGSQFLRSATALEELSLNGNNCRDLPDLPELVALQDLELSDTGLRRVPALALTMLSRSSAIEVDSIDLSSNSITQIQDDLLPVLERVQGGSVGVLLDDNPLPSTQINALRQWDNGAFRYTVDDWLYINPGLRDALEVARDDAVNRGFIDWFSGMMGDLDAHAAVGLTFQDRTRGARILEHLIEYQNANEPLPTIVADFDQRMTELRVRLRDRTLDRVKPDLWEIEVHMMMFESVLRARLARQGVPFASFLVDQHAYWTHVQVERFPDALERPPHMTRGAFINWLSDAQDTFNNNDQNPRVGEMTWRPYLGIMSDAWTQGLEAWEGVDEAIIDAYSESVNPSSWPQVLLDNLARPDADLPSAWEQVTENDQLVWRRAPLEPVADVDWTAGEPVTLTEDQLRRTMAIYRSVRSREIEALVRRITADLVIPWWPQRPR